MVLYMQNQQSQQFGGGSQPTAFNTPAPAPTANPHTYPPPPQYYPHQGGPPPQQDRPQVTILDLGAFFYEHNILFE